MESMLFGRYLLFGTHYCYPQQLAELFDISISHVVKQVVRKNMSITKLYVLGPYNKSNFFSKFTSS